MPAHPPRRFGREGRLHWRYLLARAQEEARQVLRGLLGPRRVLPNVLSYATDTLAPFSQARAGHTARTACTSQPALC